MRKFLSFFFSIALAMTMLPAAAFAVPDDGESQLVDVPQASEATLVIEPQVGNIATGTWGTCRGRYPKMVCLQFVRVREQIRLMLTTPLGLPMLTALRRSSLFAMAGRG